MGRVRDLEIRKVRVLYMLIEKAADGGFFCELMNGLDALGASNRTAGNI